MAGAKLLVNRADVGEMQLRYVLSLHSFCAKKTDGLDSVTVIDHWASRGLHFVECMLMSEEGQAVEEFHLLGIFS